MARKNTDGSPIGAYSCPSSQRGCAVVNELSAVQFYCPRATKLSLPVHDLPSQSFRSNGGYCPTVLRRFGHFLALTVPSAVGFAPCSFYAAPWRILAFTTRSHTTSQNSNYAIPSKFWRFSFAKYRTLRKNPQTKYSCGFAGDFLWNSRFWKCLLTKVSVCYILYSSQILSVFAKYDTLRKFFMEKDAPQASFCGIPCGGDLPTNGSTNMYRF